MQSNLGVQDTFLRALLLSRPFQSLAFDLLISKIDKIGRIRFYVVLRILKLLFNFFLDNKWMIWVKVV